MLQPLGRLKGSRAGVESAAYWLWSSVAAQHVHRNVVRRPALTITARRRTEAGQALVHGIHDAPSDGERLVSLDYNGVMAAENYEAGNSYCQT